MQLVNDVWNALVASLAESAPWVVLGFLVAGLLHEYMPQGLLRRHLGGDGWSPLVKAVGLGALIPTCSCSTVPLGLGLVRSGAATGTALAFMTSAPTLSPIILVMGFSLLGPEMLLTYAGIVIVGAVCLGRIGNYVVGRANVVEAHEHHASCGCKKSSRPTVARLTAARPNRLVRAVRWALFDLGSETSGPLLFGLTIATIIMAVLPAEWAARWLSQPSFYALAAAIGLALPAYTCSVPSLLIAQSLLAKGASPGVAVAFMIAGPATNLGELLALRRGLGRGAAAFYAVALICLAFAGGIVADRLVSPELIADATRASGSLYRQHHAHAHGGVLEQIAAEPAARDVSGALHWHSVTMWQWPFVAVLAWMIGLGMTRRFKPSVVRLIARLAAKSTENHRRGGSTLIRFKRSKEVR
ncbi:MAG: permease [Planctomycetaceae bacterium]|nr:permease [Planctomycetaceae bacterium]